MDIVKINESYRITDNDSGNNWKMEGTASHEVEGSININFSVSKTGELEEYIGNFSYNKPIEGNIDANFNVSEENRDSFVAYADTVIDAVLTHFSEE